MSTTPRAPDDPARQLPAIDDEPDEWGPDHDELELTDAEVSEGNADGETLGTLTPGLDELVVELKPRPRRPL